MPGVVVLLGPEAVIIALALILLWWAAWQMFGAQIVAIGDALGPVGGLLSRAATTVVATILTSTQAWIDAGVTPLGRVIAAPVTAIAQLFQQVVITFQAAALAMVWAAAGALDGAVTATLALLGQRIEGLTASLDFGLRMLRDYVINVTGYWTAQAGARVDALEQATWGRLAFVQAQMTAGLAAVAVGAAADTARARAEAEVRTRSAEQEAADAVAEAERIAQAAADRVAREAREQVEAQRREMLSRLATFGAALGVTTAHLNDLLPQLEPILQRLKPDLLTCLEVMCRELRPDVANVTGSRDLITSGLFALMLTEAITEPVEAAHVTEGLIVEPVAGVMGVFRALVGAV